MRPKDDFVGGKERPKVEVFPPKSEEELIAEEESCGGCVTADDKQLYILGKERPKVEVSPSQGEEDTLEENLCGGGERVPRGRGDPGSHDGRPEFPTGRKRPFRSAYS